MGKRCSPVFVCFALLVAFDSAFAAEIEAVIEKDNPVITRPSGSGRVRRYPWKRNIVTTLFWIGEPPHGNNLVPNHTSAWDKQWARSYGGFDDPNPANRRSCLPVKFTPWSILGENNTFVINARRENVQITERSRRNEVGVIGR